MTVQHETPASVYQWIGETFPGTDPDSPRKSLRALEELVELCVASGADWHTIVQTANVAAGKAIGKGAKMVPVVGGHSSVNPQPDQIPAELADVVIVLYGVAGMRGIDLQAEVDKKMAINRARRWKPNGDGTGYHIKEPVVLTTVPGPKPEEA
jgi:hypothetical protein